MGGGGRPEQRWLAAGIGAAVVGSIVRVLAARGDLWLDEIGAFMHAQLMRSPADAILVAHNDNNHALNTMWAYLLGPHRPSLIYRLPCLAAGIAAIPLAGRINELQTGWSRSSPRSPRAFALGSILATASYLMVHYSSEARGYALALCFGLTALLACLRAPDWRVGRWTAVYGASMTLALVAHALAVHVLAGVVAWHAIEAIASKTEPIRTRIQRFLSWQVAPLGSGLLLYLFHYRLMVIAGGPRLDPVATVASAAGHAFGLPKALALPVAIVLVVGSMAHTARTSVRAGERRCLWVFYLVCGLLSPAALYLIEPSGLIYERYFVVSLGMLLLLLAGSLERIGRAHRLGELSAACLVGLLVVGNAPATLRLIRWGRGDYLAALRTVAANAQKTPITIGGDQDLRILALVGYYWDEAAGADRKALYLPPSAWTSSAPDWFIWGWQEGEDGPPSQFDTVAGGHFKVRGAFRYSQLSGFNWAVYERVHHAHDG